MLKSHIEYLKLSPFTIYTPLLMCALVSKKGVNRNGKIDGMGITHPRIEGQSRVIRMGYDKAKLDTNLTAYAELHGTGTPAGDPIEVRAVLKAMNGTRPANEQLLIGAVSVGCVFDSSVDFLGYILTGSTAQAEHRS